MEIGQQKVVAAIETAAAAASATKYKRNFEISNADFLVNQNMLLLYVCFCTGVVCLVFGVCSGFSMLVRLYLSLIHCTPQTAVPTVENFMLRFLSRAR